MLSLICRLACTLWKDDAGSVIATEYLALGTVVGLGTIAGLDSLRSATVSELQEYGNSIRSLRQQYSAPGYANRMAQYSGSAAVNQGQGFAHPGAMQPNASMVNVPCANGVCAVTP